MMRYFVKEGLFESANGVVTCLKLAKRLTQSMTSNPQMRAIIDNFKNHDDIMTESQIVMQDNITLDNTREDKKLKQLARNELINDAFVFFWSNMFLSKKAKPLSLKSFTKAVKDIDDPMHFAEFLKNDTEVRFKNKQLGFDNMNPTTYLNQCRWEDDYTVGDQKQNSAPQDRTQAEEDQFTAELNDQYARSQAAKARREARELL